jgi:hypothetical protein
MIPARYLYLVDIKTDEPMAIFSLEKYDREGDVILYEAQLCAEHKVEDSASGLALRDSLLTPLPDATLQEFFRAPEKAFWRAMGRKNRH